MTDETLIESPAQLAGVETVDASVHAIDLLGMRCDAITRAGCAARVREAWRAGQGGWIVTPNLDHLRRWLKDEEYGRTVIQADMCVADGMPLIWASRLQGTPLPERVAGSDLIFDLSEAAAGEKVSAYFIGGEPGTAQAAAERLCDKYPGLGIAGVDCPPRGFENDPAYLAALRDRIESSPARLVFVGLGSPKQEYFIRDVRHLLPEAWWIGIGISFSFVCGHVQRAPRWMQRSGTEWMHRLTREPKRLWRRYLVEDMPIAAKLMAHSVVRRFRKV